MYLFKTCILYDQELFEFSFYFFRNDMLVANALKFNQNVIYQDTQIKVL